MPRDDMGETVFSGYDRATLDREYDNRGKVANYAEYLTRYHFSIITELGDPGTRLSQAILRQIGVPAAGPEAAGR